MTSPAVAEIPAGGKTKPQLPLIEVLEQVGLDTALEAFEKAFPHAELTVELGDG